MTIERKQWAARDWDAVPLIPRIELPSLAGIADADARFYLTMYLRGAQESDQEVARMRCEAAGICYETAKQEADRT